MQVGRLLLERHGSRAALVLDGPEGALLKGTVDGQFADVFRVAVALDSAGVPRSRWLELVRAAIVAGGFAHVVREPPAETEPTG